MVRSSAPRAGCVRLLLLLPLGMALVSCNAATTALTKQNLDVQTHMSDTIFLDPVGPRQRTVYLSVRNTSDHAEINLKPGLAQLITDRGYVIVDDPQRAHFIMQLNVLQAGPVDPKAKDTLLAGGYGTALDAAVIGASAGALTSVAGGNNAAALGVGLGLAAATFLADTLVKDVYYTVVTDIQLAVRPAKGGRVTETTSTARNSGSGNTQLQYSQGAGASEGTTNFGVGGSSNSTSRYQTIQTSSDFVKYNVRSVAYANQVNLKFDTAVPVLVQHLSSSIANLFE